jgi:hypothetical protein
MPRVKSVYTLEWEKANRPTRQDLWRKKNLLRWREIRRKSYYKAKAKRLALTQTKEPK